MKLNCGVTVVNRVATNAGIKSDQKFKNAVLAIMKPPKDENIYLLLITPKNKSGTRYKVFGNIEKIFSQFKHEGKTTIRFKEPPNDIQINADKINLGNFLLFLKKILNNEIQNVPNVIKITQIKNSKSTKMEIKNKSQYPTLQGFPSGLQSLVINDCNLKRVDSRILKLKSLTMLCLDKNSIIDVPHEVRNLPLKYLSLSHNKLGQNLQNWNFLSWPLSECLEYINLSGNEMKFFPSSLCRFHKLKVLKLSNISISTLPFQLFLLHNLQELDLSRNSILALPGTVNKRHKKFDTLDISENKILQLAPKVVPLTSNQFLIDNIPTLFELSVRSTIKNRIFYNELSLPHHMVLLLDKAKLCHCGKICLKDFGSVYSIADPKSLANTIISSHRIHSMVLIFKACCRQHLIDVK